MDGIWARPVLFLIALSLAGLLVWPIAGPLAAVMVAAAGLLFLVVAHYRHIALLRRWLRDPVPEAVPHGWGVWDRVFADLYRLLRLQRQSESQLSATLEEFRQAGAAMPDGMVILDAQDRIEWCNPTAESHFGLDRSRDTGQSITNLVRQPQFIEYLQAQNYGEPLVQRLSRGADIILSVQLVPYGDRQKLVIAGTSPISNESRPCAAISLPTSRMNCEPRLPWSAGFLETIRDVKAGRRRAAAALSAAHARADAAHAAAGGGPAHAVARWRARTTRRARRR